VGRTNLNSKQNTVKNRFEVSTLAKNASVEHPHWWRTTKKIKAGASANLNISGIMYPDRGHNFPFSLEVYRKC
jgi:hypothetical protein